MTHSIPLLAWARSPVAPVGSAFNHLQAHELSAPVLAALLAQTGLPAQAIDAVVLGNAMGAGGNPARMTALAAGLPQTCAAISVTEASRSSPSRAIVAAVIARMVPPRQ